MNLTPTNQSCCGCGVCKDACPKKAITMKPDEHGFVYPHIDDELCVDCGICFNICALKNSELENSPQSCYAGITKATDITKSSSGGIFAALAKAILDKGGEVFGAALEKEDDTLKARHVKITREEELPRILGSKYVQSDTAGIFPQVKEAVKSGKKVLFSGTPCQVDAVKAYLKEDYKNLLTVDILCHGVPNALFFSGYIDLLEKSRKDKVTDFKFRDKKNGWQYKTAKVTFNKGEKYIFSNESSYLNLFESGVIARPSCYECKYAKKNRVGDITLGDYWGVNIQMPELFSKDTGLKLKEGVSAVIVNTKKGEDALKEYADSLRLFKTSFEAIEKKNDKLSHPTLCPESREAAMNIYCQKGFEGVDVWWKKRNKKARIIRWVTNRLPAKLRQKLARLKG